MCFERRDDTADQAGRMGCATDAGCMDPGRHSALREHIGTGLDENALLLTQALPFFPAKMRCDERVGTFEGTHPSCLQISPLK